jgi:hypothetical protein
MLMVLIFLCKMLQNVLVSARTAILYYKNTINVIIFGAYIFRPF